MRSIFTLSLVVGLSLANCEPSQAQGDSQGQRHKESSGVSLPTINAGLPASHLSGQQPSSDDVYRCDAVRTNWMNALVDKGVKGVSLTVQFTWADRLTNVYLERVRYFNNYNQTNETEIVDQERLASLRVSHFEDELYEYARPYIAKIIEKEAETTKLRRSYGSFTYSLYDDQCRRTGYFPPRFVDTDETQLMREAEGHHTKRVQELLKYAGQINSRDQSGRTALLHAVVLSHSRSTIAILLAAGANANIPDYHGATALINACQLGEFETAQLLLSHGADVNARNDAGETALMKASAAGRHGAAIVRLLSNSSALVNEQDTRGATALMVAAHEGSLSIVQDLLRAGAVAEIKDKSGKTARDYASDPVTFKGGQNTAIIRLLDNRGPLQ